MKVYGTPLCIDCRNFVAICQNRGIEIEYVNITESTKTLKEYLVLRDTHPAFEPKRGLEKIGIPFIMLGDKYTFNVDEAFSWIGQEPVREEEIIEKRPEEA
ncbi:MAG: hypothetical protein Q4C49_01495 [Bacillota bacterium]|nr:hypothetical protein [Bacillota bacterium]